MEENQKIEFSLEEEVEKSKILKSYPATAMFVVESGKFKNYQLHCLAQIDKKKHSRIERLSERANQFLIKYLVKNYENKKVNYSAEFQVRENNETGKTFYCWIITFTENYKYPMLVGKDEKNYLESFVLTEPKATKAVK